jgi:phage terminase large subunit GpA-like protein
VTPTLADVDSLLDRCLTLATPPVREPLSDWADQHRVLSSEASASPGPWKTLAFQKDPLDCIAPGSPFEQVVMVFASQLGKSEMQMNLLAYIIAVEPGPTLIVQPTLDMAATFSRDRLAPMVRDTPVLRGRVADAKSKSGEATMFHKRFVGGHVTLVGSNSAAGLASRPIRYLLLDEVDRFETSAGAEGDAVALATARTRTFWNRKIIMTSSPTIKGASRIEAAWAASDQREYQTPCPNCETFSVLQWPNIEWPEGKPELAAWRCPSCAELIGHSAKAEMVERGRWRAKSDNLSVSRVAGFRLAETISPWRSWGDLAQDWERCKDSPEQRKVFINTSLAEWVSDEISEPPAAETLAARCEPYAEVPMAASLLTCGVDIQADRCEAEIVAWGRGFESWSVQYVTLYGNPSEPHLWQQLDALLSKEWRHESNLPLRISACAVDAGFATDECLNFTKSRFSRKIFGIKGLSNGWSKPIWPRRALYNPRQLPFFLISVDEGKAWFFRRLMITEPGPGYCHFRTGTPLDYFRMLVAETLTRRMKAGRVVFEWRNLTRARNEALDARVYAIASLHSLLMSGLNIDAHTASFETMLKPPVNGPPALPNVIKSRWMDF